jgi:phytoene dehydrogenase-like protein
MNSRKIRWIFGVFVCVVSSVSYADTLSQPLPKRVYHSGDRIAIIGAGAGGLAVARSLIDHGVDPHKIEVFEKSPNAGGKVKTTTVDGRPFELGAQMVIPGVYGPILDLVKKYGLTLREPGKGANFDLASGKLVSEMDAGQLAKLSKEMALYEYRYSTRWKSISEPLGFATIPEELNKSWPDFVKEQGFETIHVAVSGFIGGSGYLAPQALPQAAQMVRMLTPYNLTALVARGTRLFNAGFQTLWELEAQDLQKLGVVFHYNTGVTGIVRQANATLLSVDSNQSYSFEHVFYTGNLAYLPKLLTRLSELEEKTYSQVVNNDYRAYILRIDGLNDQGKSGSFGFLPNTVTAPVDHAVLSVKPYADSDVHVFYAYGSPTSTDDEILAGINSDLSHLNAHVSEMVASQKWDYFPHVTSDLGGFFRGVLSLEGSGGVWVTGEATSFTATIEVYKQGRDFAQLFVENKL